MKFSWSAEITLEVQGYMNWVAKRVARYLDTEFAKAPLDTLDITLCYVPILMNHHHIDHYPARSRRRIKERIVYCAPQLSHDRWMTGSQTDKVDVWMTGLNDAIIYLERFGISDIHLDAFKACIARRPRPKKKDGPS